MRVIVVLRLLSLQRGSGPLHVACQRGRSHIAKMLIERGADIDIQSRVYTTSTIMSNV